MTAATLNEIIKHLQAEHHVEADAIGFMYLEVGLDPLYSVPQPLASQILSVQTGSHKYICEYCQSGFITYKGMKQHVGKIHLTKNKNVKCSHCPSKFKHKYALKFHIQQVHESSTRVRCPNCWKILYNKYSLKKHLESCK